MIPIYIPSRGRPLNQPVAEALHAARIPFTIVCTKGYSIAGCYKVYPHLIATVDNLAEKRQWIMRHAKWGPHIQIDDDLRFYARVSTGSFQRATPSDLRKMVNWFDRVLKRHAHAGLVDKFMSHTRPRGTVHQGRYAGVLGYNLQGLEPEIDYLPRFGDVITSQEHDFNLQLITQGYAPAISCEWSKDSTYYLPGGCTSYRTAKLEREQFKILRDRWPKYVTLKKTPHSKSGLRAQIAWGKALKDGQSR